MQRTSRKVLDTIVSRTKIYLAIIFILLAYISVTNTYMILPCIIIFALIVSYSYYTNNKRRSQITESIQDLTLTVDSAAKTSLINSPFPLVILETDGNLVWKSSRFATEFANTDIKTYLNDLSLDIKNEILKREKNNNQDIIRQIEIDKKTYKIVGRYVKSKRKKTEYMVILYFIDDTENIKLQKEYKDSKSCVGIIMVDNYEETMQRLETEEKPQVIAEIDKYIYEWTDQTKGVLIKTEKDRYTYFFEQRYLEAVKEDKFSILDKIKEINLKEKVQFTLSIAISNEGSTDKEKYKSAEAAMDIVLGRGGDQAVIRENEIYKFFGGRAQEVEKRTKVKARIIAQALENLMKESKKVMIMGHTNPDMDVVGSALGVYRIAKTLEKNAYIVIDNKTAAIEAFNKSIEKDPEYEDVIINKEVALENVDEDTLLVIVDTHKLNYVESEELVNKVGKIVIIDHHRRSADFIEKATLTFQEVYASSTAELVTELIQYVDQKVELKTIEAESLYAGIMMDTKNFTFKTGVRTFEAAAYLRRCGVDIIRVKKWFQSNLANFNKIAEIVGKAEIINSTIAISICEEKTRDVNVLCAKAADELLTISEITASFVIGTLGDKVCISGRSIGDINVQVILEKLGGGGHITLAGAQVEGMTMEETKQELINRINEYFSETGM